MIVTETERLVLREMTPADAPFLHALLTDRDFLTHVGDRGVKTLEDAARVIPERYMAGYARDGFGVYVVIERASGTPLGMAGLVNRDGLDNVDLGYAFLPAARGRGYAVEAARAVIDWADAQGITPLLAIVNPDNGRSIAVLEKLGFGDAGIVTLPGVVKAARLFRRG